MTLINNLKQTFDERTIDRNDHEGFDETPMLQSISNQKKKKSRRKIRRTEEEERKKRKTKE